MKFFTRRNTTETVEPPEPEAPVVEQTRTKSKVLSDMQLRFPFSKFKDTVLRPSSLNVENGILTVSFEGPDGTETTVCDLLTPSLKVTTRGTTLPLIVIQSKDELTYKDYYTVEIVQDDLREIPELSDALREILTRNMIAHGSATSVLVDMDTWDDPEEAPKYTNHYRDLSWIYQQDIADAFFDGVDENTLLNATRTVSSLKTLSSELDERHPDDDSFAFSILKTRSVHLAGENMLVSTDAVLARDEGKDIVIVSVLGPGFRCSYGASLEDAGTGDYYEDLLTHFGPTRSPGAGIHMVEWSLRKNYGMGDFPGDRPYTRMFARMGLREWLDMYLLAKPLLNKVQAI